MKWTPKTQQKHDSNPTKKKKKSHQNPNSLPNILHRENVSQKFKIKQN